MAVSLCSEFGDGRKVFRERNVVRLVGALGSRISRVVVLLLVCSRMHGAVRFDLFLAES